MYQYFLIGGRADRINKLEREKIIETLQNEKLKKG